MSKQLFDDAIGEVPPSTVDVDAVVARGRRADRMRRVASPVLATVAAVAVVLGGVAVVVLSGDDAGLGPAGPASTTRPAPTTSAPGCSGETTETTGARLTGALTGVVSGLLPPGGALTKNPDASDPAGRPVGPLETVYWNDQGADTPTGCPEGSGYYLARASVRTAAGTGSVLVMVDRSADEADSAAIFECDDPDVVTPDRTSCHSKTTPEGDKVVATGLRASAGSRTNRVDVLRTDGTFVVVEASNMATDGKYPGPPDSTAIPFTTEQLEQIARDADVTLFPR